MTLCHSLRSCHQSPQRNLMIPTPIFLLDLSVSSLALHSWRGQGMPVGLLEGSKTPGWEEVSRDGCQVLWRRGDCWRAVLSPNWKKGRVKKTQKPSLCPLCFALPLCAPAHTSLLSISPRKGVLWGRKDDERKQNWVLLSGWGGNKPQQA